MATAQEIQQWFQSNPGANDQQIYGAMKQYGVTPNMLSSAMGWNPSEVGQRYATQAKAGSSPTAGGVPGSTTGGITTPLNNSAYTQPTATGATPTGATMDTLSNWAAPYVTNMLGQGQALANAPYQAYTGPLTAGASGLQEQAFQGLANLTVPTSVTGAAQGAGDLAQNFAGMSYDPTQFGTQMFGREQAEQYMNPYLQTSLNPQLQEARRQAEIQRMGNADRLTRAGAYGGSRQAVQEAENDRNLMDIMGQITGRGYDTAYTNAMGQFNADQGRLMDANKQTEASRQFSAGFGMDALKSALSANTSQGALGLAGLNAQQDVLGSQLAAGKEQRGITSEGITADYDQFREERAWPYQQLQFQQSLMQGLPMSTTQTYGSGTDPFANALQYAGGISSLFNNTVGSTK